ncbi:MAG: TonB-dependent receptor [Cyclobacteriaceae bacterium]|nr:MAG: TonB-dependent receptor [Cyclobacteriaceae bacterium]
MTKSILLLLVWLVIAHHVANGQARSLSGSYQGAYLIDVFEDLESRYDIQFYFEPNIDSTIIDLKFTDVSMQEMLEKITAISGINFLIKDEKSVIATGEYIVQTELNDALFADFKSNKSLVKEPNSILANIREVVEQDIDHRLENVVIEIGDPIKRFDGPSATIAGYIKETKTGEPVIGASVYIKEPLMGVITDQFGYFALTLPKGRHEIHVNSTGMKSARRQILLNSDGSLNVELRDDIIALREVVVTGESNAIDNLQTGFANINMKNIRQIPSIMGEADIMKIALTLPGVQTVGEGAAGFNVRGGSADQNLVLLNDVTVYNTNHLFGFFSVFNPDVIASADLYKSGIGAQYGGRVSSVFDVALRDGNKKKFTLKGGISPITGKVTIEGPIKKDTSSYIIGIRSTYSDYLLSLLDNPDLRNSTGGFFDIVAKVTHRINDRNDLILSAYHSGDNFRLNTDSLYEYFNSNAALQWRHTFSNQLQSITSVSFANYNYNLSSEQNSVNAFDLKYNIEDYSFKTEFSYSPRERVFIKYGLSAKLYQLQPGNKLPLGGESLVEPVNLLDEKALESGMYGGYEYDLNNRLSVYGGFRLSMFNRLGPGQEFIYRPESPKEVASIADTISYSNNENMKTYIGPELRLSGRYKLKDDLSLKISYDRINQYLHVLSNTTAISPTDAWRLSGPAIKPQIGNQYSVGLYKTFFGTSLEMSLEGYYKKVDNVLEYKDGADIILNEALETDVIRAKGKSYGVEMLLKKQSGKLSGWLSYTYARSLIQANGEYSDEQINSGEYYPSNYDKPHSAVLITNYKINRRVNIALNVNYSTGRPATFPSVKYELKGQPFLQYTSRNQFRIPDYFRIDLAVNFEGNHRVHKKVHGSWSFSVYNLTSHPNAYSVFFRSENGEIKGYRLSIYKNAVPTVTYNFRLQ